MGIRIGDYMDKNHILKGVSRMSDYKETYINTDGDRIMSSSGKSRAEIHNLEVVKKEEIYSVTVYISKDAITFNMKDGSRYEYTKEWS